MAEKRDPFLREESGMLAAGERVADILTKEYDKSEAKDSVQGRATGAPFDMGGAGADIFWLAMAQADEDFPRWSLWPHFRDMKLRQLQRDEGSMLGSAVYARKTRFMAMDYTIEGPPRLKMGAQKTLDNANFGRGFVDLVEGVLEDLTVCDNGVFLEKIGPGDPDRELAFNKVHDIARLDSVQCWRSFNPEYPVYYTNPYSGLTHRMHHTRVVFTAENQQGRELARGIGFSAVSRAVRWAKMMRNTVIYRDEKVSGRFTRAIGVAKGMTRQQVKDALLASEADAEAKGFIYYKGIPVITVPGIEPGKDIDFIIRDLAGIPDGFEFESDMTLYAYILAFVFGVDAREFWPATTSGATKADAAVQHQKMLGKSIGAIIKQTEWLFRQCLPARTSFIWDFVDDEADLLREQIRKERVNTLNVLAASGAMTPEEVRAVCIAEEILNPETLEQAEAPVTEDTQPEQMTEEQEETERVTRKPGEKPETPKQTLKNARKDAQSYRLSVRAGVRGLWNGEFNTFQFVDHFNSAINRHFPIAWYTGAAECGVTMGELTEEENTRLRSEINRELGYVLPFAQAITEESKANGGKLQPLMDRADYWVNAYERLKNLGRLFACKDKKLKWVRNPAKKSCEDCSKMDGRVYRASTWKKANLEPRSSRLACKGLACGCDFQPTDEPALPGVPPLLITEKGRKLSVVKPVKVKHGSRGRTQSYPTTQDSSLRSQRANGGDAACC